MIVASLPPVIEIPAGITKDGLIVDLSIVFASATDGMVKAGINSGKILSEFVKNLEGRGGGRPNAAQGTIKTTENIEKYLKELEESF